MWCRLWRIARPAGAHKNTSRVKTREVFLCTILSRAVQVFAAEPARVAEIGPVDVAAFLGEHTAAAVLITAAAHRDFGGALVDREPLTLAVSAAAVYRLDGAFARVFFAAAAAFAAAFAALVVATGHKLSHLL